MSTGGVAQAAPSAAIPEVVYTATEFAFGGPEHIAAGVTGVTLVNSGKDPHEAQFARLRPGKTIKDFETALKANAHSALAIADLVGGPNTVDPGLRQRVVLNFQPGAYVILCLIPDDQDGILHAAKGMVMPLQVIGAASTAAEPQVDGRVTLRDFGYVLPTHVQAGHHTWKVTKLDQSHMRWY